MRVYLGSPGSRAQAEAVKGRAVLLSFAAMPKTPAAMEYLYAYDRVLLDSGAYSELNSGAAVDLPAYIDWVHTIPWADAWAGLDDIRGDWRRSLKNYEAGGFPTVHDTDPDELLPDLISLARERGGWIGVGLLPPRSGRMDWLRRTFERIPPDLHVHGWALGAYANLGRINSFDSTHWWRESHKFRKAMPWLTETEALDLGVKKLERMARFRPIASDHPDLFTTPQTEGEAARTTRSTGEE